jgi:NTE family protein
VANRLLTARLSCPAALPAADFDVLMTIASSRRAWLLATLSAALSACSMLPTAPPVAPSLPTEPPPVSPSPKPPRIGLALGGGARAASRTSASSRCWRRTASRSTWCRHLGRQPGGLALRPGKGGRELQTLAETMDEGAITDWSFRCAA